MSMTDVMEKVTTKPGWAKWWKQDVDVTLTCPEVKEPEPIKALSATITYPVIKAPLPMEAFKIGFDYNEVASPPAGFTAVWEKKQVSEWQEMAIATGRMHARASRPGTEVVLDRFVEAVKAVIAEAGVDHVYALHSDGRKALYVNEGKGDCLVGRALVRMGHSPASLATYEGYPASTVMGLLFGPEVSAALCSVASAVQTVNDTQLPWGRALSIVA